MAAMTNTVGGAWRRIRAPRTWLLLSTIALAYLAVRWWLLLTSNDPILGADARTYWGAPYSDPYRGPQLGLPGAYLYPPAFLQVLWTLRQLPGELFQALGAALGVTALVYLVGPIGGALAVTALPFVFRDLLVGNIHLMLAAAIVLGIRHPAAWAFPILTKVTPGVGVLWFAARREWGALAIAFAVSAAIALVSFAISPALWAAWVDRMRGDTGTAGGPYLAIFAGRLVIAALLVLYAGWRRRPWLIPIAVLLSLPILWPDSLAILLACFPLLVRERRQESQDREG
jgi:hypothetical protein